MLMPETTYNVLATLEHALVLAQFFQQTCKEKKSGNAVRDCVAIMQLPREDFEHAREKNLVSLEPVSAYPPWQRWAKGIDRLGCGPRNIEVLTRRRYVASRLKAIKSAIGQKADLLTSPRIETELNFLARAQGKNAPRYRFWFVAYLIYGAEGLLPGHDRCGRWDRTAPGAKLGRSSLSMGRAGCRLTETMITKCVDGYWKHEQLGRSIPVIYRDAMRYEFGARSEKVSVGRWRYLGPKGVPVPTLEQFRSVINSRVGKEVVSLNRLGSAVYRSRNASKGKFSEGVANINECSEGDAYVLKDSPRGFGGAELPPTVMVTVTDGLTGTMTGVGGSPFGETAEAYRCAEWSAAVGLARTAKYFGLLVDEEDCPDPGLSQRTILDRGAGSGEELGKALRIRELTLAYSGQSKAMEEASHPRAIDHKGAPSHLVSRLDPAGLHAREILRAVIDANSDDASARATPKTVAAGVLNTPMEHWRYYRNQLRDSSRIMPFADATRKFLRQMTLRAGPDGVEFSILRYRSEIALFQSLLRTAKRHGKFDVQAYVLSMCVRYIWIDFRGQLIELEACLPVADDEDQLYMSVPQLVSAEAQLAKLESIQRSQKQATKAYFEDKNPQVSKKPSRKKGARNPQKARRSATGKAARSLHDRSG